MFIILIAMASTISLISAIVSTNLSFMRPSVRIPHWLRVIAFRGLSTILFCTSEQFDKVNVEHESNEICNKVNLDQLDDTNTSSNTLKALSKIFEEVRFISLKVRNQEKEDAMLSEWKNMAKIVDRLLFWITVFGLLIVVMSIYI